MQHAACIATALLFLSWSAETPAHGFAVRYDLPIPLGFFLAGAAATIAPSFLFLGIFATANPGRADDQPAYLVSNRAGAILSNRWVPGSLQAISAGLLLLVVAAALFGDTNLFRNII